MTAVTVGGVPFEIGPTHVVSELEHQSLKNFSDRGSFDSVNGMKAFQLRLQDQCCSKNVDPSLDGSGPTTISTDGSVIRLRHRAFRAEIEAIEGCGCLHRDPGLRFPLEVTLRVVMCSRLPLIGAVPLHAAGIIIGGTGVIFFGPSGAGKSTISALSPYPVLSDELVVAGTHPPSLSSAGFFASGFDAPGQVRLSALVELDKGEKFSMVELGRREAFHRLLPVTMVPTSTALWDRSMAVLYDLVSNVPVFRMAWSPSSSPWTQIQSHLNVVSADIGAHLSPERREGILCE